MAPAILAPLLLAAHAVWLLAPGLLIGIWLYKKNRIAPYFIVPVAGLVGCIAGYGSFWFYLANTSLGMIYSGATLLLAAAAAIILYRQKEHRKLLLHRPDVTIPLALMLLVSLFFASTTLGCSTAVPTAQSDQLCHANGITFDNVLPHLFADNVYNDKPRTLMGDWQGSDRPPLQTGVVLMQSPLTVVWPSTKITSYQILATLLQCLWVPVVWAAARCLRLSKWQIACIIPMFACTAFFFFNSVFVWPKLVAGSLVVFGFLLVFLHDKSYVRWGIASLAIALGFLSHSSVIFTLIPMLALLLLARWRPSLKLATFAAATCLITVAPWLLYQKLVDPPGNRLLKWHIAGVENIDTRSILPAMKTSYATAGPKQVLLNKANNLLTIVGTVPSGGSLYGEGRLSKLRDVEFRYILFGLGAMNLGWLALLSSAFRKRLQKSTVNIASAKLMLGIAAISLPLWALTLFGPDITVIHAGSYATILLLFIGLGAVVSHFPTHWLKILLTLQLIYFILVWVLGVFYGNIVDYIYVIWMVGAAAGIAVCLRGLTKVKLTGLPHAAGN